MLNFLFVFCLYHNFVGKIFVSFGVFLIFIKRLITLILYLLRLIRWLILEIFIITWKFLFDFIFWSWFWFFVLNTFLRLILFFFHEIVLNVGFSCSEWFSYSDRLRLWGRFSFIDFDWIIFYRFFSLDFMIGVWWFGKVLLWVLLIIIVEIFLLRNHVVNMNWLILLNL